MMAGPSILSVRKQDEQLTPVLKKRLVSILPETMRVANIDMWLILCQEDNLDPVYQTMIPLNTWTPILQMLVFSKDSAGKTVEGLNLSMTDTADLYHRPWQGRGVDEQWQLLVEIIKQRDPQTIGINIGSVNWAAGGLTHNLYLQLIAVLPEKYKHRLVTAEPACSHWLMTLTGEELDIMAHAALISKQVIADCYSPQTIKPGVTTTTDLEWSYWQKVVDLGLQTCFKPYFNLVRSTVKTAVHPIDDKVIRAGDMIHCDVGLRYMRLCSDHQEWAYVLEPGEVDAPKGLKNLFTQSARLQKVFMQSFEQGLSGNQLLSRILSRAKAENIPNPKVYSHSLGFYLHEPGPLIGLPWEQISVLGRGDVLLKPNSCFTMELSIEDVVPEWDGQLVRFSTEQDVKFTDAGCEPFGDVQTGFYLVPG